MDQKAPKQALDERMFLDSSLSKASRCHTSYRSLCASGARRRRLTAGESRVQGVFPLIFKVLSLASHCFVVFGCGWLTSLMSLMLLFALYSIQLSNKTKSVLASKFKLSSFLCLPTLTPLAPTTRLYELIHYV